MLPIRLKIEGLYSYQKSQVIDFQNLTDAGLFGIFGETGSGKSSILEAISYVLYGETERLNNRDSRTYNMMNLKSDRLYIEFDFLNWENKKFRATKEIKRNTKHFEKATSPVGQFYEFQDGQPLPTGQNGAEILGLSYANFKRTIIIPQGQFKEFLELGNKDRTEMMKEIFELNRFDLYYKAKNLSGENTQRLNELTGKLSTFEAITVEEIQLKGNQLVGLQKEFSGLRKVHEGIQTQYEQLKEIKGDFERLHSKKKDFERLKETEQGIDQLEKDLVQYESISKTFKNLFETADELRADLKKQKIALDSLDKEIKQLSDKKNSHKSRIKELTPYFEQLDLKKTTVEDLKLIRQIRELQQRISTEKERLEKGKGLVEETNKKARELDQKNEKIKEKIEKLKSSKIDEQILLAASEWYSTAHNLKQNYLEQSKVLKGLKHQIISAQEELREKGIDPVEFEEKSRRELDQFRKQKKELEDQRGRLVVQQKLAEYADDLKEGTACPLCGAVHHPEIIHTQNVTLALEKLTERLLENETGQEQIHQQEKLFSGFKNSEAVLNRQIDIQKDRIAHIKRHINRHFERFKWERFDPKNEKGFKAIKTEHSERTQRIEVLLKQLDTQRKTLKKAQGKVHKYETELHKIEVEVSSKNSEIKSTQHQLKVLNFEDYKDKDDRQIKRELQQIKAKNKAVAEAYKSSSEHLQELQTKWAEKKGAHTNLSAHMRSLKEKEEENQRKFEEGLKKNNLSQNEVKEILQQDLNTEKTRQQIQDFKIAFNTLKNSILEIEEKLKGRTFDEEAFNKLTQKHERLTAELKGKKTEVDVLSAKVKELKIRLKAKKALQKKESELQKRRDNLNLMLNLFKGSGFVKYISSVYLQQLCLQANERFQRMTHNQLSLQLNADYGFDVIDYLNGGKKRSVKTLSGGQAFQASLSLALALAESVQSKSQNERNFFFIDEGFGTQDKNAINTVFETLLDLNKENKVVGIISHVEELKDRIATGLQIVKDPKRGSLIEGV